jgi:hypothetical protein
VPFFSEQRMLLYAVFPDKIRIAIKDWDAVQEPNKLWDPQPHHKKSASDPHVANEPPKRLQHGVAASAR